jgi:hypothetical protein
MERLDKSKFGIEFGSIYGAALLLPQVARSLGWPLDMTLRAIRMYVYLAIAVTIQVYLLCLLSKEEFVMDSFAGQMWLCDFGVGRVAGKEGPGGIGPGGTAITPAR